MIFLGFFCRHNPTDLGNTSGKDRGGLGWVKAIDGDTDGNKEANSTYSRQITVCSNLRSPRENIHLQDYQCSTRSGVQDCGTSRTSSSGTSGGVCPFLIPQFNGVAMMSGLEWSLPVELLASDVCLKGPGAVFGNKYFHYCFPEFILAQDLHINALELLVFIVALKAWGRHMRGRRMTIHCDNQAFVWVINSGRAKDLSMQ